MIYEIECSECSGSGHTLIDCECVVFLGQAKAEKYGCSRCHDGKQSEPCPTCNGKGGWWLGVEETINTGGKYTGRYRTVQRALTVDEVAELNLQGECNKRVCEVDSWLCTEGLVDCKDGKWSRIAFLHCYENLTFKGSPVRLIGRDK